MTLYTRLMLNFSQLFSLSELEQLTMEIGARPDEVAGETTIERAASLIEWAERNEQLTTMMIAGIRYRPDARWH